MMGGRRGSLRCVLTVLLLFGMLGGLLGCSSVLPKTGVGTGSSAGDDPSSAVPGPPATTPGSAGDDAAPNDDSGTTSDAGSEPGAMISATVVRVVDGDTAVFRSSGGAEEKVRFIGVDTPESTKTIEEYGREASAYTQRILTPGRQVVLEKDVESRDRYGRLLAYVWLEQPSVASDAEIRAKMFNAHLALGGYAQQMTIPPNVKYADFFRVYVAEARESDRGLWRSAPQPERRIEEPKAEEPEPSGAGGPSGTSGARYIGNSNTMKFHYPSCSSVPDIRPYHVVQLASRASAISEGYKPCGRCRP
jgi:micrococcal nuclease